MIMSVDDHLVEGLSMLLGTIEHELVNGMMSIFFLGVWFGSGRRIPVHLPTLTIFSLSPFHLGAS